MTKELFITLQNLVKTKGVFKFGYMPVPKGIEYDIDTGLNEDMEVELKDWITGCLSQESEYHATDYKLTFEGDIIHLDCNASWGGWCYENDYTCHDLLTEEVVRLLLPETDFRNVDVESLHLTFEYTLEEDIPNFKWLSEYAYYYGDGTDIEIPLAPIKVDLEKVLHTVLCDFSAYGDVDKDGIYHKTISVEQSIPDVVESKNFKLKFDFDELDSEHGNT